VYKEFPSLISDGQKHTHTNAWRAEQEQDFKMKKMAYKTVKYIKNLMRSCYFREGLRQCFYEINQEKHVLNLMQIMKRSLVERESINT